MTGTQLPHDYEPRPLPCKNCGNPLTPFRYGWKRLTCMDCCEALHEAAMRAKYGHKQWWIDLEKGRQS